MKQMPKGFLGKLWQLSLRILDILEYIHEHDNVHGDVKAFNLLRSNKNPDRVYLVDYGLAYRYCPDGAHKEYKEDPKRCHDGTLEFTSIDAHNGVGMSTLACCVHSSLLCLQ